MTKPREFTFSVVARGMGENHCDNCNQLLSSTWTRFNCLVFPAFPLEFDDNAQQWLRCEACKNYERKSLPQA